jgi:hypothetical protein
VDVAYYEDPVLAVRVHLHRANPSQERLPAFQQTGPGHEKAIEVTHERKDSGLGTIVGESVGQVIGHRPPHNPKPRKHDDHQ